MWRGGFLFCRAQTRSDVGKSLASAPGMWYSIEVYSFRHRRYLFMTILCYSRCPTWKKALKWLDERQIPYTLRDIKEENPSLEELKDWYAESGLPLKKFFNTSGQAYRSLGLAQKLPAMTEEEQLALLASDGMLVKRPLVVGEAYILTGFREAEWEEVLGK